MGPILRAASCKLQALQAAKSKKSRASHLWCRSCELRAASCELPLQATKKSRSKVDPCTCEAAARQRCRLPAAAVGHHARTTSRVYGSRARHPDRDRARRYRVEAANSRVVGRGEHITANKSIIFGTKGILERGRQRLDAAAGFFNLLRHSLRLRLLYPALRAPRHANHHVYWSMVGRVCAAAGWELKAG